MRTGTCPVFNHGSLPLCLDACDPLTQDCPEGDVCVANPNDAGFLCVIDASKDEGQQHDPCDFATACRARRPRPTMPV